MQPPLKRNFRKLYRSTVRNYESTDDCRSKMKKEARDADAMGFMIISDDVNGKCVRQKWDKRTKSIDKWKAENQKSE